MRIALALVLSLALLGCNDDTAAPTADGPAAVDAPGGEVDAPGTTADAPPAEVDAEPTTADAPPGEADAGCTGTGTLQFGETCATDCDCESALCFLFGDGTQACTITCTDDPDCPVGSAGQKCNNQGVCRP